VDWNTVYSRKRVLFIVIFGVAALIAQQINFSQVLGAENQFFTMFQFLGPIAGGFLGPIAGAASVLLAEIGGFLLLGKDVTFVNLMRLTPMLFAAYYFATRTAKISRIVPLVAMAAFLLHPVGAEAWYYSLYWLIPVIASFLPENLFMRSLGATFTAHSVGGVVWIYTFPTTAAFWTALIPIVAFERLMFAGGITSSFIVVNTVLHRFVSVIPVNALWIDARYVLTRQGLGLKA